MKKCSKCGKVKKLHYFYNSFTKRDGRQSQCIECKKTRIRTDYNKEKQRIANLARLYSVSYTFVQKLLAIQDNKCAICKVHRSKLNRGLSLDHCHAIGFARGLLCIGCNARVGVYEAGNLNPTHPLYDEIAAYVLAEGVDY